MSALGLLDAAAAEVELLAEDGPIADETGIDLELWGHVSPEVQSESWGKVASQAVIFTEDRIRRWTGRPNAEVGKDLAVAVFGKSGQYQIGLAEGGKQGRQLLAQGIAQAVRNVDAHRIQERPDHKRPAILADDGIAVSMLLPSITATEFGDNMFTLGTSPRPGAVVHRPDYVAAVVMRLLRTGEDSFDIPHGPEQPDLARNPTPPTLFAGRAAGGPDRP